MRCASTDTQKHDADAMTAITVFGPSSKFLSGISYFTVRLSNALTHVASVHTVLFRDMLPLRLFPGWRRVGRNTPNIEFVSAAHAHEVLDWYNPITWMQAYSITRKSDVVILPWWTSSVAHMYLFIEMCTVKRRHIVIDFHEPIDPLEDANPFLSIYAKTMGVLVRALATGYVAHTTFDRDLIVQRYRIPGDRVAIIPHGVYDHYEVLDKAHSKNALGLDAKFVILFFGLVRPFKGIPFLIHAFEQLPVDIKQHCQLVVVGEQWDGGETANVIRNSPDSGNVVFVDRYISDREISQYYSSADVFVAPYTSDAHDPCAVCHIAMMYGMPIIASYTGGMIESLSDYRGTLYVAPENSRDISKALETIYSMTIALPRRPHYPIPHRLEWSEIARQWESYIQQLRGF